MVWVIRPDVTAGHDSSDLEDKLPAIRGTRPMTERVRRFLENERAKTFTWRREGSVYRLEGAEFVPTRLGRVIFVRVQGDQMQASSPDGSRTVQESQLTLRRVPGT